MARFAAAAKTDKRYLQFCSFGRSLVPYESFLKLQKHLADRVYAAELPDTLLQLQHSPVYTLGKRGRLEDFRTSLDHLKKQGLEIHDIGRGGEVTFHGPGQVVMYPIVNLRRLGRGPRAYVEGLEDTVVHALLKFGISSQGRQPGRTGVWVGDRKIAAIGIQISCGIATHGVAVNVSTDLAFFDHIVPCGIADREVTSVEKEVTDDMASIERVSAALKASFVHEFGYKHIEEVQLPVPT